jgi:hypothetical protein
MAAASSLANLNGPVRALGQRLTNRRSHALRPGADYNHLAAMLLFLLQRLFESVCIRLVHRVVQIGFFNPLTRGVDPHLRVPLWHLFDCDNNFHD